MSSTTELVTIDRVARALNWSDSQKAKQREEVADLISAVTMVVEDITGPVVARAFDEWHDGGWYRIMLDNAPVLTVTLVTESWGASNVYTLADEPLDGVNAGDAYGYTIDKTAGAIIRRSVGQRVNFAAGRGNVHIQYTAGLCADTASVPANIRQAALEIIRFAWQPQQTGNWAGGTEDVDTEDSSGAWRMGYFVPGRAMGLLKPSRNTFGVA